MAIGRPWQHLFQAGIVWGRRLVCVAGLLWLGGMVMVTPVLAELDPILRENFLSDPLKDEMRDPFLPDTTVLRPLSPLEKEELSARLDKLNIKAADLLAEDEVDAAFNAWMRELRLRRTISIEAELLTMQRIAEVTWVQGRVVETQLMTERLEQIQAAMLAETPPDLEELAFIAQLFEDLREPAEAVVIYETIAEIQTQQGNLEAAEVTRRYLGELHLAWINYSAAEAVFDPLLAQARAQGDRVREEDYLQRLIYLHQQANQHEQAIAYQQQLINFYQEEGDETQRPALELAIARNYRDMNRPDLAVEHYKTAYAYAQELQQFSYSSQVLWDLADLYESLGRDEDSLTIYGLLLQVEQQTYNAYGLMRTYDRIGQVYRRQEKPAQALSAFQEGLVLAQQLSFQEEYFQEQIESVANPATVPPEPGTTGDIDSPPEEMPPP